MLDDTTGRLVLVVLLLAAASAVLALRRRRDGTFAAPRAATATVTPDELGAPLGRRATFVQFSARTCAICPQVRRTLADVAARADGVAHVDVPADERLDLASRFGVLRTPTVLLVDGTGTVRGRTSGPMTAGQAVAALAALGVPAGRTEPSSTGAAGTRTTRTARTARTTEGSRRG